MPVKKTKVISKKKTPSPKKVLKEKLAGKVIHYFSKPKVAVVKLKLPLIVDEKIKIKGGEKEFEQKVKSMEIDKKKIKKAKAKQEIGLKVSKKAKEGYKVFKFV